MKKYLAVLLTALMAVSVVSAAGVVTAQKAGATPPAKGTTITVPYETGKTYTWTPKQFNVHYTSNIVQKPSKTPPPKVQAWSRWGTASTSVQITKTAIPIPEYASAGASVGVVVTVTPPSGYTFTGNEPVTVTYNGKYTISALGSNKNTYSSVRDETYSHIYPTVEADGSGTAVTESGTFGTPDARVMLWFGTYDQTTGNYVLTLWMSIFSGASGVSQASATIDVSSVTLMFN